MEAIAFLTPHGLKAVSAGAQGMEPHAEPAQVELALGVHAITGECPVWSETERALYWIDIEEPALHRFDPETGDDQAWQMPAQIGAFAICRSGAILAALRTGLVRLSLAALQCQSICKPPYNPLTHRFNEGKCDARGRFWIGAMWDPLRPATPREGPPEAEALHFFEAGKGLTKADASAVIANGLAWTPDSRSMYFADTHAGRITIFDWDVDSARLSSPQLFADFSNHKGKPDGAAVDVEGHYWCALYGGACVARLSPAGKIVQETRLPVSQPTMCAFGGADYETLYITTASKGISPAAEPHAGGLFRVRPGVKGLPPSLFDDRAHETSSARAV